MLASRTPRVRNSVFLWWPLERDAIGLSLDSPGLFYSQGNCAPSTTPFAMMQSISSCVPQVLLTMYAVRDMPVALVCFVATALAGYYMA